jgi:hypothetical protein
MKITIDIEINKKDLEKFKDMSWEHKNKDIVKNTKYDGMHNGTFYYGVYRREFLDRLARIGVLYKTVNWSSQENYHFTKLGKLFHKQLNSKQND